jgi:hypothetical protein
MAQRDTITLDVAGEIDAAWINAGMPCDGLRIVGNRINGNRTITTLTVPGNDRAPGYVYTVGKFLHVYGPTLADWQAEQDAADLHDTQRCAF